MGSSDRSSLPLLLTEAEAAERLRLCQRTLRKARKEGLLHCVLIGRAVRYTVADLESYIEALRKVQKPCPPSRPAPKTVSNSGRSRRQSATIVPFTARRRSA